MTTSTHLAKAAYHHGNLAEALVSAATSLVEEQGVERFSMADASRIAGVSKGAPYRHFNSKEDLLRAVVAQGFEGLAQAVEAAGGHHPAGSDEAVTAIGLAYVGFATERPALFRLMFSGNLKTGQKTELPAAFRVLLQAIRTRTGLEDQRTIIELARPLWTLVHGASMLTIDNNYQRVDPDGDTQEMLASATRLILSPYPSHHTSS